jgi:glycosyltransferase involved in cell wall biosynthesis
VAVLLIGCVGSLSPSDACLAFESTFLLRQTVNATLVLIGKNIHRQRYDIPPFAIETPKLSQVDLYNYIGACDVMLMPFKTSIANNGRWPSKLNDYLVMGKPVVSTDICVVRELFKIARFGDIAKDEPIDFARSLQHLLTDHEALRQYSTNAYSLAAGFLSWDAVVNQVNALILATLNSMSQDSALAREL